MEAWGSKDSLIKSRPFSAVLDQYYQNYWPSFGSSSERKIENGAGYNYGVECHGSAIEFSDLGGLLYNFHDGVNGSWFINLEN